MLIFNALIDPLSCHQYHNVADFDKYFFFSMP